MSTNKFSEPFGYVIYVLKTRHSHWDILSHQPMHSFFNQEHIREDGDINSKD